MKMLLKILSVILITCTSLRVSSYERPMVVVIPSFNNAQWVEKNLSSVYEQQYANMRVIFIDDCSSDLTYQKAVEVTEHYNKQSIATIIHNEQRCGALANLYNAIVSCKDHEIIVTLDGDDWLSDPQVLSRLNKYYEQDIWMTYGQFQECPGDKGIGHSVPFPENVIKTNSFRSYHTDRALLPASHLRTFYAWLFKCINIEDLKYEGQFYSMSWDMAFMLPMLEMSGSRHVCINEVMYIYNRLNPISDCYKNTRLQLQLAKQILQKEPYNVLSQPRYFDNVLPREMPITVIIVAHNNENTYERCLCSVLKQEYNNFRTIVIDDASTDLTASCVQSYCARYAGTVPVVVHSNNKFSGAVACFYRAVHECRNDEIVLMMSCNDWLDSDQVLSHINTMFHDPGLWFVYGVIQDFPEKDCLSGSKHCIACYAELLKKIKLEDIVYKHFFYPIDFTTAVEGPLLQLAGPHVYSTSLLKCVRNTLSLFVGPKDESINKAFEGIIRARHDYEPMARLDGKQEAVENTAHLIIISEDDPVQLDTFLSKAASMLQSVDGIDVLYYTTDANKQQYEATKSRWPAVHFEVCESTNIQRLLLHHVAHMRSEFCGIFTDRVIIEEPIDFGLCAQELREHNLDVFFISLAASLSRLGMFLTTILPCVDQERNIYAIDCENKQGLRVIPIFEIAVWSKKFLAQMLENIEATSLQELKVQLQERCLKSNVIGLMFDSLKVIV